MFYRLKTGYVINLMNVSYITPPDRRGVCMIYLAGEEDGFEANPFEAEDIVQLVGEIMREVLEDEDDSSN